ncbi:MAG: non-canonical purine NTP pyrophosphatase [Candidatus Woesearchaeota archaeon]|nr:non-canonical purine NTP pyrophosphatase [Candidatus Woesearchaeota archaeon]
MISFITSNTKKFEEAKAILPSLEQKQLDLPEIQDTNPEKVVGAKLKAALKHCDEVVVEDTSLHMDCLGGLPGPFIKHFLETIGPDGLFELAEKLGNNKAQGKAIFGYGKGNELHFFEGIVEGTIVKRRVADGFGWDLVFQPDGESKTFAEMTVEEKNKISHRKKAAEKLREFLN